MPFEIKLTITLFFCVTVLAAVLCFFANRQHAESDKQYTVRFMACVHAGKPPAECKLAAHQ